MESVGIINKPIGVSYSLSGPVGRSLGIIKDQRFNDPYETFKYKSIPIIYTKQGFITTVIKRNVLNIQTIDALRS